MLDGRPSLTSARAPSPRPRQEERTDALGDLVFPAAYYPAASYATTADPAGTTIEATLAALRVPHDGRLYTIERALRLMPAVDFVNAYGLTETSSTIALLGPDDHREAIASTDPAARRRLGSVGRPLPSIELEVRDDLGHEVAHAVACELVLHLRRPGSQSQFSVPLWSGQPSSDPIRSAVAAVHAGWRGTVAKIVPKAIAAMGDRFGTMPADLHAAIGPGIGKCCYEVGPEVAEQFGLTGRGHIDLPEANRRQLVEAGVAPERIYVAGLCTKCHGEDFHSFRRDKDVAGRMYSFAGIR